MKRYVRVFQEHSDYSNFTRTEDFMLPNVSYCINENDVHYNPIETRLVVKYNVVDASQPTQLYLYYAEEGQEEYWTRGVDMFDKVEIDGTEVSVSSLDANEGFYQLSSGEHTVAYTLKNPTLIGYDPNDPERMTFGALLGGCAAITNVVIPNSVTSIGDSAFDGCSSLTSVTIPNSVTSIGFAAFALCTSLTSVTIGSGVTSIGDSAFGSCSSLTSVTIPNSVTSIGSSAFYGCTGLESVTIGSGVTSIGSSAFCRCTGLTSVTIGDGVESIGQEAFQKCSGLTSVTIPNSVTSIGERAFCGCPLDAISKAAIEAINPNATSCGGVD